VNFIYIIETIKYLKTISGSKESTDSMYRPCKKFRYLAILDLISDIVKDFHVNNSYIVVAINIGDLRLLSFIYIFPHPSLYDARGSQITMVGGGGRGM
jgi:hypothetical protein